MVHQCYFMKHTGTIIAGSLLIGLGALVGLRLLGDDAGGRRQRSRGPAPVEVAEVQRRTIEHRRTFTGTLQARERSVIAADVRGRVARLLVDLGDPVSQGQVIAELDDDDQIQGVAEAAAEVSVAEAGVDQAESALEIATRELQRAENLRADGVLAEAQLDSARARHLERATAVKVAAAALKRQRAALQRARIRTGYTKITAQWTGDDPRRFVARRHVDEGDRVDANQPLFTIVDLEPLTAVVHVTEADYGLLAIGNRAEVTTDAYPGQRFHGMVSRIAPVFDERTRQARMELAIDNPDRLLKPGMFMRAELVLRRVEDATVVPYAALANRAGTFGVFVVDGDTAAWRPVEPGIREGDWLQVVGDGVSGRVVTLGHQLISDGAQVVVPDKAATDAASDSAMGGARAGARGKRRGGPR